MASQFAYTEFFISIRLLGRSQLVTHNISPTRAVYSNQRCDMTEPIQTGPQVALIMNSYKFLAFQDPG